MFCCVAASQLVSCVRCCSWKDARNLSNYISFPHVPALSFCAKQNFCTFSSLISPLQLFSHLTFIFWKACNAGGIMHLLKITPLTPHHLTDSLPSMNTISRSKSVGVCTPSLKVGLTFAETIRHLSVLSISGGVCQFLPPISFEAHNCRKCRLKVGQCACLLPATGKIPT